MADFEAPTPCCPSCSVAVPDASLRCAACGWDFTVAPPLGGFAIPPARDLDVPPASPLNNELNIPNSPNVSDLSPDASAMMLPASKEDVGAYDESVARPGGRRVDARLAAAVGVGLVLICVVVLHTMRYSTTAAKTPIALERKLPAAPLPPSPAAVPTPPPSVQPPTSLPTQSPAQEPLKQRWIFTGVVYDLNTTKGVFGVGLIFYDAGQEVGATESDEEGRYRVTLPEGGPEGYSVRIMHEDYSDKHIDEINEASTLRRADLKQRHLLMHSRVRAAPWIGVAGRRMRRDVGLVPLNLEKP